MMRLLQIDSLTTEGITKGRVSFLAHSDGGFTVEVEEWIDDVDDNGDAAAAILVAVGDITIEGADKVKEWINEVAR